MEIVFNFLLKEWNLVRQSLKDKLSSLDFNTLANGMLLEREHLYTSMGIQCTSWSARKLDHAAKFILWFDMYELSGHDDDDIDDIIKDPDYVPTR